MIIGLRATVGNLSVLLEKVFDANVDNIDKFVLIAN